MTENNPPVLHTDLSEEPPSPSAIHFVFIAASPIGEDTSAADRAFEEAEQAQDAASGEPKTPGLGTVITAHVVNVVTAAGAGLLANHVAHEALFAAGVAGVVFSGGMLLIRKVMGK